MSHKFSRLWRMLSLKYMAKYRITIGIMVSPFLNWGLGSRSRGLAAKYRGRRMF